MTLPLLLGALAWLAWALWCHVLLRDQPRHNPGLQESARLALAFWACRLYARVMQRVRAEHAHHIPGGAHPAPLIVVSNHTSGVDPLVIQALCPFEIRWMMANDMRWRVMEPTWELLRIIGVDRSLDGGPARDTRALREAIRHVQAPGVLGLFPEGRIERPTGSLLPFHPGVGMIVSMTGAPVLPVLIRGTPRGATAWASLFRRGSAIVHFGSILHFPRRADPDMVVRSLREWYLAHGLSDSPRQDVQEPTTAPPGAPIPSTPSEIPPTRLAVTPG